MANPRKEEDDVTWIFRPYYRHKKTGKLIWAKNYGKKAWRIPVSSPPHN